MTRRKILVVGGGIGGLTAAISLSRAGHRVTLVEKSAASSAVGAGIILAPNATRLLGSVGVDLLRHPDAWALPALIVSRADGRVLQRLEPRAVDPSLPPIVTMTRPGLQQALLAAVPADVETRFQCEVEQVTDGSEAGSATFGGSTESFDIIVGADGINSRVRTSLADTTALRYSGTTCWRGLVPNPGIADAMEVWGDTARVGLVPLADGQLYYFLVVRAPARAPSPSWPDGFRAAFGKLGAQMDRLWEVLKEPPPLHHDLIELDAPTWGRGRVFLLGDSAHAMTPNLGQGAAMAIEDAIALTRALEGPLDAARQRYVRTRNGRVRRVQLQSRRLGEAAHWEQPIARGARDLLMRLTPQWAWKAQYRRLLAPGLRLLTPDDAPPA